MKRPEELIARGLITGLIGAAAVAIWFLFIDFSDGHPFRTPAALGSALLFGITGVEMVKVTFGVVASYTLVHVVAFVVAGMIFVWIAEQVERSSSLVLLTIPAAIALEAVVVAGLALGAEWVLGTLGVWSVLFANLFAVLAMGGYIWRTHPRLRHGRGAKAGAPTPDQSGSHTR